LNESVVYKLALFATCHANVLQRVIADTPEYADNAAALLGGLTAGQIYRTGDNLKIVH